MYVIIFAAWLPCYDDSSGCTYYWNQLTNVVTWDIPHEYLIALKIPQQKLASPVSAEVSSAEWHLYKQAVKEKENNKITLQNKKCPDGDNEEEKIELISSYHNSESDSNDETETPVNSPKPPSKVLPKKNVQKKQKKKTQEYGPALPPNMSYSVPIGPELPPELINTVGTSPTNKTQNPVTREKITKMTYESQDENTLMKRLKDETKLLEKLGADIPKKVQQLIQEEIGSDYAASKSRGSSKSRTNIDECLDRVEKKELPKYSEAKIKDTKNISAKTSHKRDGTPPIEPRHLFPIFQNIKETPIPRETDNEERKVDIAKNKTVNLYLSDIKTANKKKLRLSNEVLPKKEPAYTTKYSKHIEGYSNERVGLGFVTDENNAETTKNTINYEKGLVFTKGETLNEEKEDKDLNDLIDMVEKKLKYLNQIHPSKVTPTQEMLIQMQTLADAFRAGALSLSYWRRWATAAHTYLVRQEQRLTLPGWTCSFVRSEGRYCYCRVSDGFVQYECPAAPNTEMDICTTPPHPGIQAKFEVQPPLPPSPIPVTPPLPPPHTGSACLVHEPPPPGCEDLLKRPTSQEPQRDIGAELATFYSDIAQIENTQSISQAASTSLEPEQKKQQEQREIHKESLKKRERDKDTKMKIAKKQSRVKICTGGLKHKSVSSLVAKWKQVAAEKYSN
ncbi:unnamed protein product [Arctia plantaginis]|uniref:WW domain-containing protein n=1 Tax=Arctia plantaginis TaxID=874455 RepID=A0A8S1BGB5_ARCPL|nr:unnamed protein product [Arctia plantaginis]